MADELPQTQSAAPVASELELLGAMTRHVAHDLANLFTSILGFGEMALARAREPKQAQYLERSLEGARRAEEMVLRMLEPALAEAVDPGTVDLRELVAAELERLGSAAGEEFRVLPDLGTQPVPVHGPAERVRAVVVDLCAFGAELVPAAGALEVELRAAVAGAAPDAEACARLLVRGAAGQQPAQVLTQLLDALLGASGLSQHKRALLRLAFSCNVVRLQRGTIRVAWDGRQVLQLELPLAPVAAAAPVAPAAYVLLVEDEPAVRHAAGGMLRYLGYEPLEAPDAASALEACKAHGARMAAILLDVSLSGVELPELVESLCRLAPGAPLLLSSGDASLAESAAAQLGALVQGVLPKPFRLHDLDGRLREAIARPR